MGRVGEEEKRRRGEEEKRRVGEEEKRRRGEEEKRRRGEEETMIENHIFSPSLPHTLSTSRSFLSLV